MKIAVVGLNLAEGKVKYHDPRLTQLEAKLSPKKTNPLFVELVTNKPEAADAICCLKAKVLDIIIPDMEILERRLASSDEGQKQLLSKCTQALEKESLLCDLDLSNDEKSTLKNLQLTTLNPTVVLEKDPEDTDSLLKKVFDKAGIIFFYTTAKGDLKSWPLATNTAVVEAAAKIHSDLARGFIKAEVVGFDDFMSVHNMQEAKVKGFVKVVDKEYIVQDGDIIEIRFNV